MITKIRIGNDIKLAVDIRQYNFANVLKEVDVFDTPDAGFLNIDNNAYVNKYEVYKGDSSSMLINNPSDVYYTSDSQNNDVQYNPISIRSIKAILVNTSREKFYLDNLKKKTRFISRFPIEPYIEAFRSTPYNVCNSGYPTWRAYPVQRYFAPYHGFGVTPDWRDIYPTPKINDTKYVAEVTTTDDPNIVSVFFPAKHQLHVGIYKLIIVAKVYAPGYNKHNLRTITVDLDDVFELVNNSNDAYDNDMNINVHITNEEQHVENTDEETVDVYVDSGVYNDGNLLLNRTDGSTVDVDFSSLSDWYEGE